ncbi:MAG: type II CAAX endopeptidase family protein [Candidatus Zixiibacteriota bacterium]
MEQSRYERETVYPLPGTASYPTTPYELFKFESGNEQFRVSRLTYASLVFLLLLYPGVSFLGAGGDPRELLRNLTPGVLMVLLVTTVVFQWVIFLLNYVSIFREGTGLTGIGLGRLRLVDLLWAVAFLLAANLILSGLAWGLGQVGLPMPGEVGMLIPKDAAGKVVWVVVALTAGFCEEVAFRGYLMTRLRLLGRFKNWLVPTILSAVAFGACHAYQGIPGFIVITVYGVMFSLLFIHTGRLWPCIIAHFLQDFGALFFPH